MKRDQIEELFYGKPEQQRRFTQDFPILPDVWIEYGKAPDKRVEVLLTPHNESDAPRMARALPATPMKCDSRNSRASPTFSKRMRIMLEARRVW